MIIRISLRGFEMLTDLVDRCFDVPEPVIPPLLKFDDSIVLQRFLSAAANALTSMDIVLDLMPSAMVVTGEEKSLMNSKLKTLEGLKRQ